MNRVVLALLLLSGTGMAFARNVLPTHTIEFDTNEGTSINVDVSPDGKRLIFDLLGDLYTLPITGGKAQPLLSGRSWDRCPRFSPDGKEVSFISDRVGVDSVWVLNLALKRLRRVTSGKGRDAVAAGIPEWLPGGREIAYGHRGVGRMTLSAVPSAGGEPRPLVPEWKQPAGAPGAHGVGVYSATFTRDGSVAFFSALGINPTRTRQPPHYYALYRYDRISRALTRLTEAVEGRNEFRPEVSKSGHLLAYIRSSGFNDTELRVRNLVDGSDRRLIAIPLTDPLTGDWSFSGSDDQPAYAFTPDDRFVILWYGGKLHRVSVSDGSQLEIPFRVHVQREVAEPAKGHFRIPDGQLQVRGVRWPTLSPDKDKIAFSAVGSIWLAGVAGGKPQRLTDSDELEFMPAFSPDGKSLAYVAFPHTRATILGPGRLRIRVLKSGETREIQSGVAGNYLPSWSPDGGKLAVIRQVRDDGSGVAKAQFGWIDLADESFHPVAAATALTGYDPGWGFGQHIVFAADGNSLFYEPDVYADYRRGGLAKTLPQRARSLHRVSLDGSADRELATANWDDVFGMFPSPDGSHVLLEGWNLQAYLASLPKDATGPVRLSIASSDDSHAVPQISVRGSLYPAWTDSRNLTFSWTNQMFGYRVGDAEANSLSRIDLEVPRRGAHGTVAFTHARLITVSGEHGAGSVVEHGTLVIRDRRIESVGPDASVSIPHGAAVIDARGLTIMPGLIESHSHGLFPAQIAIPIEQDHPSNNTPAALAYGITTAWEAKGSQDDGDLTQIELLESGRLTGQRWFSAGGILNREDSVPYRDLDDVRAMVRRKADLGARQCLKDREEAVRTVVQWYATAAREAGVCLVAHTEAEPEPLAFAGDGVMIDHPSLPVPSYRDILQYFPATGVIWTPHALLADSLRVERVTSTRVLFDELVKRGDAAQVSKYARFSSSGVMGGLTPLEDLELAPIIPFEETPGFRVAKLAAQITAAGGKVTVSSDGGLGIENHFEMWAFARAGMPVGEVLRAATMNAAEKLGIQDDVGSLVPGKLADFLVLTANPLERIENSLALKYTVVDGEIYDSNTLDTVTPRAIGDTTAIGR